MVSHLCPLQVVIWLHLPVRFMSEVYAGDLWDLDMARFLKLVQGSGQRNQILARIQNRRKNSEYMISINVA